MAERIENPSIGLVDGFDSEGAEGQVRVEGRTLLFYCVAIGF